MPYKPGDIISIDGLAPFPKNKTAKELGLKIGDMVVVLKSKYFKEGEIIELYDDDKSYDPRFSNGKEKWHIELSHLAPLLTMKKTLPRYFAIKRCYHPLWKEYIDWLNKTYKCRMDGISVGFLYGYDGNEKLNRGGVDYCIKIEFFKNSPTLLTLEEWKEMVTEESSVVTENSVGTDIDVTTKYDITYKRGPHTFLVDRINSIHIKDMQKTVNEYTALLHEHSKLTF